MRAAHRHLGDRGRDEDPREVPARAGERGVGPAARARPTSSRFLRTYAEALGLDSELLLEEYKLRHERLSDHELHADRAARRAARAGGAAAPAQRHPARVRRRGSWSLARARAAVYVLGKQRGDDDNADDDATSRRRQTPAQHDAGGGKTRQAQARERRARASPGCRSSPTGAGLRVPEGRGRPHAGQRRDARGRRDTTNDLPLVALHAHARQRQRDDAGQRQAARRPRRAERRSATRSTAEGPAQRCRRASGRPAHERARRASSSPAPRSSPAASSTATARGWPTGCASWASTSRTT